MTVIARGTRHQSGYRCAVKDVSWRCHLRGCGGRLAAHASAYADLVSDAITCREISVAVD